MVSGSHYFCSNLIAVILFSIPWFSIILLSVCVKYVRFYANTAVSRIPKLLELILTGVYALTTI